MQEENMEKATNQKEQDPLEKYKLLVTFLGAFLGPDYEVLLHDMAKLPNSIVALANPMSGRSLGGPITELGLKIYQERMYQDRDYYVNYQGQKGDNVFRSASFFIKDEAGELIGLLCINFSDQRYFKAMQTILGIIHPKDWARHHATNAQLGGPPPAKAEGGVEEFHSNIDELMVRIFEEVIVDCPIPAAYMKQEERLEVIRALDSRGMFRMKGAVSFVADKLDCSIATVYRYLNMINWQE